MIIIRSGVDRQHPFKRYKLFGNGCWEQYQRKMSGTQNADMFYSGDGGKIKKKRNRDLRFRDMAGPQLIKTKCPASLPKQE